MKKTFLPIILLLMFFFLPNPIHAQTKVRARGTADIHKGFVQIARDRATDNAKRLAVEKAVRVYIESETLVENYALVYDRIFSRFSGYINAYEILEEKQENNQYVVRIEAEVGAQRIKRDLDQILQSLLAEKSNPRLMILFQEPAQKDFLAEGIMIDYFLSKGFKLVDPETVRVHAAAGGLGALGRDKDAAVRVGRTFGAEIIIVGRVAASSHVFKLDDVEMHANRASVAARVIKSDTGDIMATGSEEHRLPGIKGMIQKPVEKAALRLAENLTGKIVDWWQKELDQALSVRLIVKGIRSFEEANAFKTRLPDEARGIKHIYERIFEQGRLEMDVELRGKTHFLANDLIHFQLNGRSFEVERQSPNLLVMRVKE